MGKMAHPSALSSPGSHQLPRAAPGRPGGCLHVEDGTSVCSPLPWWPPSSPGQLRAGLATAGRLHREDVPSAALPSLGGHPAPQGCSGPAGRLPASSMGKMYHRLLFPPLVASQLPRAAPGRPGGCQPPPGGRWHRRLLSPLLVATSFSGQLCFSSLATLGCLL